MHSEICKFPSARFYGNNLKSARFKYRKPLEKLTPFILFTLNNSQHNHGTKDEYRNGDEVDFIKKLLDVLVVTIPTSAEVSIGVITPYRIQRSTINEMLRGVT